MNEWDFNYSGSSEFISRRTLMKLGAAAVAAYALSRLITEKQGITDNEVTGTPTIYTPKLAQEVALYFAGLNRELRFYRPGVVEKIVTANDPDDLEKIPNLVANQAAYDLFRKKRPQDNLDIVKGLVQGGSSLPDLAAPQVCHWIGSGDRSLKRSFVWDEVLFTCDYHIDPDGRAVKLARPTQVKAIIMDTLAGACQGRNMDFFSDATPGVINKLYGGNVQVRLQSPYFVTSRGLSVNLPEVKMSHLG